MSKTSCSEELLDVLHEEVVNAASRFNVTPLQAADIALSIESGLRHRIGGRNHYLASPNRGGKRQLVERDLNAGVKPAVISQRRGVSLRWVYMVKSDMRVPDGQQ